MDCLQRRKANASADAKRVVGTVVAIIAALNADIPLHCGVSEGVARYDQLALREKKKTPRRNVTSTNRLNFGEM